MSAPEPVELTPATFGEATQAELAIVDVWAPWCGPCIQLAPAVQTLAEELADDALVGKVNVDEHPEIAERLNVKSLPTVVVLRHGTEVDRGVNPAGLAELRSLVEHHR